MKFIIILAIFLTSLLISQELKVKANSFKADEESGTSIFSGKVNVIQGGDELNASRVEIYMDKKHKPTRFVAIGNVSFKIETKKDNIYIGQAQRVVYLPLKKEYHFFKSVHLKQLNAKKEIIGEEVFLNTVDGKAYAKGAKNEPVIMIFNINDDKEQK